MGDVAHAATDSVLPRAGEDVQVAPELFMTLSVEAGARTAEATFATLARMDIVVVFCWPCCVLPNDIWRRRRAERLDKIEEEEEQELLMVLRAMAFKRWLAWWRNHGFVHAGAALRA